MTALLQHYKRPDLIVRLLQHGPLTKSEVLEITGWGEVNTGHTLDALRVGGEVARVSFDGRPCWRLTDTARFPELPLTEPPPRRRNRHAV